MRVEHIKNTADALSKIENIEKEVFELKSIILKKLAPSKTKSISLRGILKGVKISNADVAHAKKSLYSKIGA